MKTAIQHTAALVVIGRLVFDNKIYLKKLNLKVLLCFGKAFWVQQKLSLSLSLSKGGTGVLNHNSSTHIILRSRALPNVHSEASFNQRALETVIYSVSFKRLSISPSFYFWGNLAFPPFESDMWVVKLNICSDNSLNDNLHRFYKTGFERQEEFHSTRILPLQHS